MQAWFEATVRSDVTDGLRTRAEMAQRAPELAAFMLHVYGHNTWLYPQTAPKPFLNKAPRCANTPLDEIESSIANALGGGVSSASLAVTGSKKSQFIGKAAQLGSRFKKLLREA